MSVNEEESQLSCENVSLEEYKDVAECLDPVDFFIVTRFHIRDTEILTDKTENPNHGSSEDLVIEYQVAVAYKRGREHQMDNLFLKRRRLHHWRIQK
ncbi:hypothetical protein TNIN_181621 [Trichonephila inaurata madagascariensis]|uniref:Uncharacterized protein n=1 Tax=Trichonephila inaurata madagascariensis TaxID=2747483 RepID=A0A8X7C778_9ARAC|nr:hypothetical protein TNIN_181621 [Trichonephila inaurata madagascariensis]